MNGLTLGLLGGYLAIGVAVAVVLARRGSPWSAAASAVVAWPLLLQPKPADRAVGGPLHDPIGVAFARLDQDAERIGGMQDGWGAERTALQDALRRADARLSVVDRILAEEAERGAMGDAVERLRAARERAAAEIAGVLDEVGRLRVQLGLQALSGDTAPLREGLRSLVARARAIEELDGVG